MDRRLTPANGRVAAAPLRGLVEADRFVEGSPAMIDVAVADLCRAPDQARERQVLLGTDVTVYEDRDGWSFVQSARDGYVGYVRSDQLGPRMVPTHHVVTPATHAYRDENLKSPDVMALPFGARVRVVDERPQFFETTVGFVPKSHFWPLSRSCADPVSVAQMHVGVPYLWGGNSTRGIDCSGLVQAALLACAIPCPADSDLQRDGLGHPVAGDYVRGDLVFWKGHVGMMVDDQILIHANAYHMAVACEPITAACPRIEAQGGGLVLAHRRL